jgi:hypothetical protein
MVQLELRGRRLGRSAIPIPLQVDPGPNGWSDTEIHVHLDLSLSGILDSPVTLVIYPETRQRMELRDGLFIAVRGEPQLLNSVPSSWVKLAPSSDRNPLSQLEYVSP